MHLTCNKKKKNKSKANKSNPSLHTHTRKDIKRVLNIQLQIQTTKKRKKTADRKFKSEYKRQRFIAEKLNHVTGYFYKKIRNVTITMNKNPRIT